MGIATISIVGFDQRQARKTIQNVRDIKDRLASLIVMQAGADPEPDEAALKLAQAVPPVFAVIEDTAYEPDTVGFNPNAFAQTLPGITAPMGFFAPAGFCATDSGADGEAT